MFCVLPLKSGIIKKVTFESIFHQNPHISDIVHT